MAKEYRLHNGYMITKGEFYNGFTMVTSWCIYAPNGRLYMSCHSYDEAYEITIHLQDIDLGYAHDDLYNGLLDERF